MTNDKGKVLEGDFKKAMVQMTKDPLCFYYRIPDALSTASLVKGKMRGRGGKRPGDFFVFYNGTAFLIELKEVAHDYRIATSRFTQLAKMKRFAMTGNTSGAIVFHTTTGLWRYVGNGWLQHHKEDSSYDLSEVIAFGDLYDLCDTLFKKGAM